MTSSPDAIPTTHPSSDPALIELPPVQPRRTWYAGLRPEPGDLSAGLVLVGILALTGVPLGVLWWLIAPRRAYLVAQNGAFAVVPESEAAVGADAWLLVITVVTAVLAVLLAWRWRARRGPVMAVALAVGMGICTVFAWQTGMLLGPSPSAAELRDVGTTVLGPLQVGAYGVLLIGPFVAVLGYLAAAGFTPYDDLDRDPAERTPPPTGSVD